ncbi:choice-of-anchor M domain-containing protein [Actinomycetes bacterium KLBMP 9797]
MLRITSRLLGAVAVATAAVVGFTASPALAATINSGHIDALDVDFSGGAVSLDIKTYSPANDDVPPATTLIHLTPPTDYDLVVTSTSGKWPCIEGLNQTAYVAPASVGAGDTRIWPGWNTEDVPVGNRPVTIELISVTGAGGGPAPGHLTLYTVALGAPSVVLSNSGAAGCADSSFSIAGGSPHGHANWAFSEPGGYDVTFRATVTGSASSDQETYHFEIS